MRLGRHRRFTANHTWHLDWRGRALFVKANPNHREAEAETRGHARIRDHYRVPALRATRRLPLWTILVYDRWPGLGTDTGLLLDAITLADHTGDHQQLDACLTDLIGHYRRAIVTTMRLARPESTMGKLYADRAAPLGRLDTYYATNHPWRLHHGNRHLHPFDLAGLDLIVNGRQHHLSLQAVVGDLRRHFTNSAPVWAAITQGDPTDVNLGWGPETGPVWFDYDTGGLNALAGEFACFLIYQRLHGAWLTPRYNRAAFADHPRALAPECLAEPAVRISFASTGLAIDYRHIPTAARRRTMARYLNELVLPIAAGAGLYDVTAWLRPYLAMRLLAVYNLAELHSTDAVLSLALLAETLDPATDLNDLLAITSVDQKAN